MAARPQRLSAPRSKRWRSSPTASRSAAPRSRRSAAWTWAAILKSLLERGLVDVVGRGEGTRTSAALRHDAAVPRALRAAPPRGTAARRRAGHRAGRDRSRCAGRMKRRGCASSARWRARASRHGGTAEELVAAGRVTSTAPWRKIGQTVDAGRRPHPRSTAGKLPRPPAAAWCPADKPAGVHDHTRDPGGAANRVRPRARDCRGSRTSAGWTT